MVFAYFIALLSIASPPDTGPDPLRFTLGEVAKFTALSIDALREPSTETVYIGEQSRSKIQGIALHQKVGDEYLVYLVGVDPTDADQWTRITLRDTTYYRYASETPPEGIALTPFHPYWKYNGTDVVVHEFNPDRSLHFLVDSIQKAISRAAREEFVSVRSEYERKPNQGLRNTRSIYYLERGLQEAAADEHLPASDRLRSLVLYETLRKRIWSVQSPNTIEYEHYIETGQGISLFIALSALETVYRRYRSASILEAYFQSESRRLLEIARKFPKEEEDLFAYMQSYAYEIHILRGALICYLLEEGGQVDWSAEVKSSGLAPMAYALQEVPPTELPAWPKGDNAIELDGRRVGEIQSDLDRYFRDYIQRYEIEYVLTSGVKLRIYVNPDGTQRVHREQGMIRRVRDGRFELGDGRYLLKTVHDSFLTIETEDSQSGQKGRVHLEMEEIPIMYATTLKSPSYMEFFLPKGTTLELQNPESGLLHSVSLEDWIAELREGRLEPLDNELRGWKAHGHSSLTTDPIVRSELRYDEKKNKVELRLYTP